jgi:diguanylate cyclase (GGDEF)-like protein
MWLTPGRAGYDERDVGVTRRRPPVSTSGSLLARILLVEAASARIAAAPDADAVLHTTASVLMENLGMETAAVNRLVPADDEYEVTAFLGQRDDGGQLLGSRLRQDLVEQERLDEAHAVFHGVYLVPAESEVMSRSLDDMATIPSIRPPIDAPDAWCDHALLFALQGRSGEVLAVLSLDDPVDGRLPSDVGLARAALLLHHAGTALEARLAEQGAARAHAEAAALTAIASSLEAGLDEGELLTRAARGACVACGYGSSVVSILSADGEHMEKVAAVGEHLQSLIGSREPAALIRRLMHPGALLSSSYLLTGDQVVAAGGRVFYRATHHGRGRRGWRDHHLLVPIQLAGGALMGILEVDDPLDRMIPSPDRLRRLEAFAQQIALVLDASRRLAQAQEAASRDPLTKLPNRSRIFDSIDAALARDASSLAVLFIDIDGLKAINDRHGHDAGDQLLVAVSRRLQAVVRARDTVGHLSGDEFIVVCPGIDQSAVAALVDRIRAALAGTFRLGERDISATASIGAAMSSAEASAETLIRKADAAMYRDKPGGRTRAPDVDD